ncbi:MAG: hypothetical protein L0Z53_02800, partial [Acidobacteriales bacterium]|nr:hypothetical protein [Terriglobales bacterium]
MNTPQTKATHVRTALVAGALLFGVAGLLALVDRACGRTASASGAYLAKQKAMSGRSAPNGVKGKRVVIEASLVLDGKGGVLRNTRIVVEGSKIVAIDPKAGPVDYDLRGLTVLPGWIDA